MIRVIHQNCARSYEWIIVGLEIEVKLRADKVSLQEPLRET